MHTDLLQLFYSTDDWMWSMFQNDMISSQIRLVKIYDMKFSVISHRSCIGVVATDIQELDILWLLIYLLKTDITWRCLLCVFFLCYCYVCLQVIVSSKMHHFLFCFLLLLIVENESYNTCIYDTFNIPAVLI